MNTITNAEYDDEIERLSEEVLAATREAVGNNGDDYDHIFDAVGDFASVAVENHEWFTDDDYGGAVYGSIVEFSETVTEEYTDWLTRFREDDGVTPDDALRKLAWLCMVPDVMEPVMDEFEAAGEV